MTNHTPGPWSRNIRPVSKYPVIFAGRNSHIAQVSTQGMELSEAEANCNLIAAAPDLLQELINIANADTAEWEDRSEFEVWAKSRARAAIAKATP